MEEKQTLSDNQKPRRFSIGSALCTAVLVLSLVLCASVLAQVLTRGYVTLGGYSLFRVVSGSMEPTISTGALLIEIGNNRNTLSEALAACPIVAEAFERVYKAQH